MLGSTSLIMFFIWNRVRCIKIFIDVEYWGGNKVGVVDYCGGNKMMVIGYEILGEIR